ncbi:MAG: DoxX family protein [Saprospiraceae bacterium]|nr:DoxX family protein [Saprospiraceae bacterium]
MKKNIKRASIYLMGFWYIYIGIRHFVDVDFFLSIMPPYLPFHLELVYLSGLIEIILGSLLMIKRFQTYAAWGIIALLIAVYPANIYLAFNEAPQQAINVSSFLASWVRLPLQLVFLGIAYWHTKPLK